VGFIDAVAGYFGFGQKRDLGDTKNNIIPQRSSSKNGSITVSNDTALKASAVWASIRLRADVVSTMPVNVKRSNPDGSVSLVTASQLQIETIGGQIGFEEFLYSTQSDLDMTGNAFGIIKSRDLYGRPTWIELVPATQAVVQKRDGKITYRFGGETHDPADVWHERQYTISGSPVGLSPLRYSSMSIGQNLSALQFGLDYFGSAGMPTVQVKNTKQVLTPEQADIVKRRYQSTMEERGVFVTGSDWEIDIATIRADESQFLSTLDASAADICRYFGVPGDIIGVNPSGQAITYANITQRFLELLVLHMQPALVRRERKFSRELLPNKVFAKFDTDALLRLDPTSLAAMYGGLVASRVFTPDEVRGRYELPPLTPDQIAQIKDLVASAPLPAPAGAKLPNQPEA
jgi:HK97 family phage portal protein